MYNIQFSYLLCCIFVCLYIASAAQLVPLNEAPLGKGIKDEYLIVAKRKFVDTHKKAQDAAKRVMDEEPNNTVKDIKKFSDFLNEKYGLVSKREYTIGTWRAVLVTINATLLEYLRKDTENIKLIDANRQLKINDGSETEAPCYQQETDKARWGLGRISYRQLPTDYNTISYKYAEDGNSVDIYVLDSGVKVSHEEFDNGRATWGYTVEDLRYEGDVDLNGHGTNVASIAAGKSVGVAKQANIVAVKVLNEEGVGYTSYTVEGLEWVLQELESQKTSSYTPKAVVNLSLGVNGPAPSLDAAINAFIEFGVQAVIAAGNDYVDACDVSPARVTAALTVGATDWEDRLTSFSNYGSCLDLSAPGAVIQGAGIGSDDEPSVMSGTSQATPFVAGVVARYIGSEANHKSPAEIADFIVSTSTKDVINWPLPSSAKSTPNRLLYMACESSTDMQGPTPASSNTQGPTPAPSNTPGPTPVPSASGGTVPNIIVNIMNIFMAAQCILLLGS